LTLYAHVCFLFDCHSIDTSNTEWWFVQMTGRTVGYNEGGWELWGLIWLSLDLGHLL
jgi:hypothetical protein